MNRYEPRSYQTLSGDFAAIMDRDDNGTYITYASHRQEIEYLQARLRALESKQKDSISISSIISEHVDDALRKSIGETVHQVVGDMLKAGINKYNGDPCHSTVDSILDELAVGPGKAVNAESSRNRNVAVCYYVNGNEFINGCEYEYEVDECEPGCEPRLIHIAQDAFVSDLQGDYRWRALMVGNVINENGKLVDAYAIVNRDGGVVAQFYIK